MLPRVVVYDIVSVDGRVDVHHIPIETVGLFYQLASHWNEDATLAGSETIIQSCDNVVPETEEDFLQVQVDPVDQRPLLVIPDSKGRVRNWHMLRNLGYWRDMIALCTRTTPKEYLDYLQKRHVQYIVVGEYRVDLRAALEMLNARYNVNTVRVDSGGILNGVLLREGLVDEVSLLIYPCLMGGTTPASMYKAPDLNSTEGAISLKLMHMETQGDNLVWLRYEVLK